MAEVRVRFAPSPTGLPHIGNIRTALFNWLFARHHGGKFILRIEDTDVARLVPGSLEALLGGLRWLGLEWDEGPGIGGPYGPYFQSQRLELYHRYAQVLLESGAAYRCYCSPQRLAELRSEQQRHKQPPGYDRRCRSLTEAQCAAYEAQGLKLVVRLKVPLEGTTSFHDLIHGEISFENRVLDDFIMLKSDGYPTYHFAVVIDDYLMAISHILRADEWISSTPKHVLVYRALGWPLPHFAHLPIILGPDRSKLSKRHGPTSILSYREAGYLPEALVNFMALLGWSYDATTEIFSREELVARFSLERISGTPAIFSAEKLDWMNGYYIRRLSLDDLAARLVPFIQRAGLIPGGEPSAETWAYLGCIAPLIQERIKRLSEAPELTAFFFREELDYDPALLVSQGLGLEEARRGLEEALRALEGLEDFAAPALEGALRPLAAALGMKTGQLFGSLRVAVTGRTVAPPLFETMAVLGRRRTLERVRRALDRLSAAIAP